MGGRENIYMLVCADCWKAAQAGNIVAPRGGVYPGGCRSWEGSN